ncbi:arginase family protein [Amycolatopsis sp. NPDC023774]|uniref:arginase family protein n=1 Tax=Amycolatopsis sp. NPDC023774 TaxID=3155015 RepID=UPI0033FDBEA7
MDAWRDLKVFDAGDVEMYSVVAHRSVRSLQEAVHAVTAAGAIPLVLGGDHTIAWPDAAGVRSARSWATASRCAG